ncbi:MAG: imm11 family protein, partial [Steroidobacteraceae bacterium]
TAPVDWVFTDGKKLEGYVFLDVLPMIHAYDYKRSEVIVRVGEQGPYISSLGYPRAMRRDLPANLAIFRDAFRRHDIFVSRELARALLAANLRGFDFEDPARQGSTDP